MRRILPFIAGLALSPLPADAENVSWDVFVGASQLDIRDNASSSQESTPSLGIGVYRFSSTHLRLGTSVELLVQRTSGGPRTENVVMWRLGELDYQLSNNLALSVSGGIARLYREQPSYGYGIGVGLKYLITDEIYTSVQYSRAETDISTQVPTDDDAPAKNDLQWISLQVHLMF